MRIVYSILVLVMLFVVSCSEDFNVGAGYKDVTVVWGILDATDTATYVKVTRGFYDEKNNNLAMATNPDSIYYKNAEVYLEELSSANSVVSSVKMDRVDASLEGFPKDPGIFAQTPNWAYKTKTPLKGDVYYRVRVLNKDNAKEVFGRTRILTKDSVAFNALGYYSFVPKDYSKVDSSQLIKINIPAGAATCDGFFRFKYVEQKGTDPFVQKFVDIPMFLNQPVTPSTMNIITYNNGDFYSGIGNKLDPASNGLTRYVDTGDYIFYCGGQEIYDYVKVSNAQGGITFDQIKPIYTNMQGKDVYGMISSKVKRSYFAIPFTKQTIDLLKTHPATKNLNFQGVSPI